MSYTPCILVIDTAKCTVIPEKDLMLTKLDVMEKAG
jgi:hypothetical protein